MQVKSFFSYPPQKQQTQEEYFARNSAGLLIEYQNYNKQHTHL